ncbi:MAG: DegT/DnrJ/EryC1/StrS family aminotransferase [Pseudomonadota bacterium]
MARTPYNLSLIDLAAQRRRLGGRIEAAIDRVLSHGQFILGPEVAALESALASYVGVRHAITCASGTDALLLALWARGIGQGDAVFVPAFTFAASVEAIALTGATPVLVDVAEHFNLDPVSLEEALAVVGAEGRLRPRAVATVDLFGHPAPYADLLPIARQHGLFVLQDAAQSFGARWRDVPAGRQGDAAATSFYPSKPLGGYGDGGAVFTDDDHLAARMRSLGGHGVSQDGSEHERIGINSRLDTLQAAVLLAKLPVIDVERAARAASAQRYANGLSDQVDAPSVAADVEPAWSYYTIRTLHRDALRETLAESGIASAVYYPKSLHQHPAYAALPRAPRLRVAERLADSVLSLPMHADLQPRDQQGIIDTISRFLAEKGVDPPQARN